MPPPPDLLEPVQCLIKGQGTLEAVRHALEGRADPNQTEGKLTPLKCAVQSRDSQLLEMLLRSGADANLPDHRGVGALHLAAFDGSGDCVGALLNSRADANIVDKYGQTPLFFASSVQVCQQLLDARADAHARNKKQQSPLHMAAHAGLQDIVRLLLDVTDKQLLNAQDDKGYTPFFYAALAGVKSTITVLQQKGANVSLHVPAAAVQAQKRSPALRTIAAMAPPKPAEEQVKQQASQEAAMEQADLDILPFPLVPSVGTWLKLPLVISRPEVPLQPAEPEEAQGVAEVPEGATEQASQVVAMESATPHFAPFPLMPSVGTWRLRLPLVISGPGAPPPLAKPEEPQDLSEALEEVSKELMPEGTEDVGLEELPVAASAVVPELAPALESAPLPPPLPPPMAVITSATQLEPPEAAMSALLHDLPELDLSPEPPPEPPEVQQPGGSTAREAASPEPPEAAAAAAASARQSPLLHELPALDLSPEPSPEPPEAAAAPAQPSPVLHELPALDLSSELPPEAPRLQQPAVSTAMEFDSPEPPEAAAPAPPEASRAPEPRRQTECLFWDVVLEKAAEDDQYGLAYVSGKRDFEQQMPSTFSGPEALIVWKIRENGLLLDWNARNPEKEVQPYDRILSVNNVRTVAGMREALSLSKVTLQCARYPEEIRLLLPEGDQPIGFNYEVKCGANDVGVRITEVFVSGKLYQYNLEQISLGNWHNVITPNFHIDGNPARIVAQLQQSDAATLIVRRGERAAKNRQKVQARVKALAGLGVKRRLFAEPAERPPEAEAPSQATPKMSATVASSSSASPERARPAIAGALSLPARQSTRTKPPLGVRLFAKPGGPVDSSAAASSQSPGQPSPVSPGSSSNPARSTVRPRRLRNGCEYWEVRLEKVKQEEIYGLQSTSGRDEFERRMNGSLRGPETLIVWAIKEGSLLDRWNKENPEADVMPQDRICNVNSEITIEGMRRELSSPRLLMRVMRYPEQFTLELRRDGLPLGCKFVKAPGQGVEELVLKEIAPQGALHIYNGQQVSQGKWQNVLLPEMRVEAANDVRGDTARIMEELRTKDELTLHVRRGERAIARRKQLQGKMKAIARLGRSQSSLLAASSAKRGSQAPQAPQAPLLEDKPGSYRLTRPVIVAPTVAPCPEQDVIAELPPGTIVKVLEIVELDDIERIRGRIESPAGWMSLRSSDNDVRWAELQEAAASPPGAAPGQVPEQAPKARPQEEAALPAPPEMAPAPETALAPASAPAPPEAMVPGPEAAQAPALQEALLPTPPAPESAPAPVLEDNALEANVPPMPEAALPRPPESAPAPALEDNALEDNVPPMPEAALPRPPEEAAMPAPPAAPPEAPGEAGPQAPEEAGPPVPEVAPARAPEASAVPALRVTVWRDEERRAYVEVLKVLVLPGEEPLLAFLCDALAGTPLPEPWALRRDSDDRALFVNLRTEASTWSHPLELPLKELAGAFRECLVLTADVRRSCISSLLELWQREAREETEGWRSELGEDGRARYRHRETGEIMSEQPAQTVLVKYFLKIKAMERALDDGYFQSLVALAPSAPALQADRTPRTAFAAAKAAQAAVAVGNADELTVCMQGTQPGS